MKVSSPCLRADPIHPLAPSETDQLRLICRNWAYLTNETVRLFIPIKPEQKFCDPNASTPERDERCRNI